jgi:protein-tyrosine-phosphatase
MAESLFNQRAQGRAVSRSGGSRPAATVHPTVVEVMREVGVDLSNVTPKSVQDATRDDADVVVTMGCGDDCPVIPGARVIDWELDDPAGRPLDDVRAIRDEIGRRVDALLAELA